MTIIHTSIARVLAPLMLLPVLQACTQETPDMQALAVVPAEKLVLTGEVFYEERKVALSAESRLRITVNDVTVKGREPFVIAEKIIDLEGQQMPLAFDFSPNAARFAQLNKYSVHAAIIAPDDMELWTTDQPYMVNPFAGAQKLGKMKLVKVEPRPSKRPVPVMAETVAFKCGANGGPTKVKMDDTSAQLTYQSTSYDLPRVVSTSGAKYEKGERANRVMFSRDGDKAVVQIGTDAEVNCTLTDLKTTAPTGPGLTGGEWTVVKLRDEPFVEGSTITLAFEGNQLSGTAGCNRYDASYKVTKTSLTITPAGMTKKLCKPDVMTQEARFAKFLAKTEGYEIDESGTLIITASTGHTLTARR